MFQGFEDGGFPAADNLSRQCRRIGGSALVSGAPFPPGCVLPEVIRQGRPRQAGIGCVREHPTANQDVEMAVL